MQRRRLLQIITAGIMAISTPQAVDRGLELIASAQAEEKAPISEAEFERLMKYDTVDDILKEYGIGSVDDASYKRKVYDSDKHVMVVFYDNCGSGAKGLGVLFALLSQQFGSKFNFLGYKMSEECEHTPKKVFDHVTEAYGLKDTPSILLYDNKNSSKAKDKVNGCIISFNKLLEMSKILTRHINNNYL